ncbi:MAG: hypothetical protein BGP22_22425 [Variovorax sp. 67-131]|nr:MAG: hypothetical protein ABS56_17440 [Lautropia sp. SCN 69-89]ODV15385.1 MAG: hypothetical protein ABT25_32620 [Variovorax sp. SCN 67-20]OJZ12731.1 MAG: hypothetical protein BGP22_22425 [Variovorax sp. 67-131]
MVKAARSAGAKEIHEMDVLQARENMRARRSATQLPPRAIVRSDDQVATSEGRSVRVRIYRPPHASTDPLPVLIYFHGGGWTVGDLDVYDSMLRDLSAAAACAVVSTDYRLAPEHPFPAAIEDACICAQWVKQQAGTLGFDASRIAVGGDSAGGNIAAVLAGLHGIEHDTRFIFQLLVYPNTDLRASGPSYEEPQEDQIIDAEAIRWFIQKYLGDQDARENWKASPLLQSDMSKLPAALIIAAGFDPLRSEGRAYADALSAAGVKLNYVCFERQIHGFFLMTRITSEAGLAQALAAESLRAAFDTHATPCVFPDQRHVTS